MQVAFNTTAAAARMERPLFTPLGRVFLAQLTDARLAKAVWLTYNSFDPDTALSYEGFRQTLHEGRFTLDNLARLCEAMSCNNVDPAVPIATLEAACIPRDPDLDGSMLGEICTATEQIGKLAAEMRQHGHSLVDYDNAELRNILDMAGRLQAATRRLMQEALKAYEV